MFHSVLQIRGDVTVCLGNALQDVFHNIENYSAQRYEFKMGCILIILRRDAGSQEKGKKRQRNLVM